MRVQIEVRGEKVSDIIDTLEEAGDWLDRGAKYVNFQKGKSGATVELLDDGVDTSTRQRQKQVDEKAKLMDDTILYMLDSLLQDRNTPYTPSYIMEILKERKKRDEGNPSCGQ